MNTSLNGKTGIVTGASSGIGRAVARRFAAEGMRLALVARSAAKLHALAEEMGADTLVIPADLTLPVEIDGMVADAIAGTRPCRCALRQCRHLRPRARGGRRPDAWDQMIALNVSGTFRTIRAVLPHMIERERGDILVTSSISGHQAIHWEPVYSASKHAVQSFVHGVRRQVAKHRVRVASLAPGMVLNELWGFTDPR